jgi:hypothetical protein
MDVGILFGTFGRDESRRLVPVPATEDCRMELPAVIINGRRRNRGFRSMAGFWKREAILEGHGIYKAFEALAPDIGSLHCRYSLRLPYRSWMNRTLASGTDGRQEYSLQFI